MSLLAIVASAALTAAGPAHTVELQHNNGSYRIEYRPHVETQMRTKGMAAGPRPSTQVCAVTSTVTVERVISAQGGREFNAMLPAKKSISQHVTGPCRDNYGDADSVLAANEGAVRALLSQAALDDRQSALAAIDAAHHLAAS